MENNTNQLNPMLCKRNCGFFGNAAYDGYCSKCYKDHVKRQNSGSAAGRVTPTTGLTPSSTTQSQTLTTSNEIPMNTDQIGVQVQQQQQQQPIISNDLISPQSVNTPTLTTTTINTSTTVTTTTTTTTTTPISTPITTTTTTTSAPIPIPTTNRTQSIANAGANADLNDSVAMSVPSDFVSSSSLLSTSTSPIGAASIDESSNSLSSSNLLGSEKKKRNRCVLESCKRKVGLTGFDCRCGGLYCWEHRYSDKHDCKFDYKELGQDQIRKNNPIVIGEKIQKI